MKRTLRCMKNEAGLRPMKRGFAARRGNEYALLLLALLVYFTLRSNGLRPCLGTDSCPRTRRGCLHTLESSAKIHQSFAVGKMPRDKTLPLNPPASSSKGFGETFSERRFPRVSRCLPSYPPCQASSRRRAARIFFSSRETLTCVTPSSSAVFCCVRPI